MSDQNKINRNNVRLVNSEGVEEVPEDFDLEGYISHRAQRERERRAELEKEHGEGNIPLSRYNPMFVFGIVLALGDIKEREPSAYRSLLDFLDNPITQSDIFCGVLPIQFSYRDPTYMAWTLRVLIASSKVYNNPKAKSS
jgi:hypothetical protein